MTTHQLTLAELSCDSDAYDRAVGASPEIDRFCTSSDWVVPAAIELMPERDSFLFRDDAAGWIAMMRGEHEQGWRYIEPLEASWGLACPLVGDDAGSISEFFVDAVRRHEDAWEVMLLSGLPLASRLHNAVLRRVTAHYEVMRQRTTVRHVAYLHDGIEGFLSRRTRNFRRSLVRARQRAHERGIEFERCHEDDPACADALFDRILAVESRSWKGVDGVGINLGSFGEFYRAMVRRLVARGSFRCWFARLDGADVAFVFGGVIDDSYRGLQMSYDMAYRDLALGNLCQFRQIEELCEQGCASYDLGTGLPYKHRWAEAVVESDVLVVLKL